MIDEKDDPKDNEDYQFNEDDLMGPDLSTSPLESDSKFEPTPPTVPTTSVTQRNAMIVVVGLLLLYLIYRLVMWVSGPSEDIPQAPPSNQVNTLKIQPTAPKPSIVTPTPDTTFPASAQQPQTPPEPMVPTESEKKLSTILNDHSKMQIEFQGVSTSVTSLQSNVELLLSKIDELNKLVTTLNAKVENQEILIKALEVKRIQPPKLRTVRRASRVIIHREPLYLQAIIPGRAWLIKRDGTDALTVREGTRIPGYGEVQIIDPHQGKVVMSTGLVIRFGQWDS